MDVAEVPREAERPGPQGEGPLVAVPFREIPGEGPLQAVAKPQAPGVKAGLAEAHAKARGEAVPPASPLLPVASREAEEGPRRRLVVEGEPVLPKPVRPQGQAGAPPKPEGVEAPGPAGEAQGVEARERQARVALDQLQRLGLPGEALLEAEGEGVPLALLAREVGAEAQAEAGLQGPAVAEAQGLLPPGVPHLGPEASLEVQRRVQAHGARPQGEGGPLVAALRREADGLQAKAPREAEALPSPLGAGLPALPFEAQGEALGKP